MNTSELVDFFENEDFNVHLFEQDGKQCAEVEKWTDGGVDMVFTLMPFSADQFIERVDDFDVDEEIELHRQGDDYKANFTISESLEDFTNFHNHLKEVSKRLKENETIYELCPLCDTEVELKNKFEKQICPSCKEKIIPCGICEKMDCRNCPFEK